MERGGDDSFCYSAFTPDLNPPIHYAGGGLQNTVCGAMPGQLLPYIPLADHGKHYDKTGEAGWRWCPTCCRMMGVAMIPVVVDPNAVVPPKKARKRKAKIRH